MWVTMITWHRHACHQTSERRTANKLLRADWGGEHKHWWCTSSFTWTCLLQKTPKNKKTPLLVASFRETLISEEVSSPCLTVQIFLGPLFRLRGSVRLCKTKCFQVLIFNQSMEKSFYAHPFYLLLELTHVAIHY